MNRLAKFKGNSAQDLAKLKAKKIKTAEDLWESIGPASEGIEKLADHVGLTSDDVINILVGVARPEPKSNGKIDRFSFWISNYWSEALILVVVLTLLSLLVRNAVQLRDTVVVNANALSAYHVIGENDVKVEKRFKTNGSFASTKNVIGRYLLQQSPAGAILLSDQLSPTPLTNEQITSRYFLSVPVKGSAINSTLVPADHVRLLFSPRNRDVKPPATPSISETSVDDAIVLAVNRQGDASSVVIAVKDDKDLAKVTFLLGTSDVFISQQAP
jgi:hypothetical protein